MLSRRLSHGGGYRRPADRWVAVGIVTLVLLAAGATVGAAAGSHSTGATPALGAPPNSTPNGSPAHPKVADGLLSSELASADGSTVEVVVETRPGHTDRVARAVRARGAIRVRTGRLIEATVPRSAVTALADRPGVTFVRRPIPLIHPGAAPTPRVGRDALAEHLRRRSASRTGTLPGTLTSEGIATIRADQAKSAGYTGEGVTVAVLDTGFDVSDPEIADNVVRTKDFTGGGISGGGSIAHGTSTAQIVVDAAPDVRLVLVSVQTYAQMSKGIEWVNENVDPEVASMSLGLASGRALDGTTEADQNIVQSERNGTVWMVAAGNEANGRHWNGSWQDGDGDGWLNVTDSDETIELGGPLRATVQWNDWPQSDQNYDLYLYNDSGGLVATSETVQNGSQPPIEQIAGRESGVYSLKVKRVDGSGSAKFDLFYRGYSYRQPKPDPWTAARTITVPATSPGATAVGAVDVETLKLEAFSSRGPTIDGRRKPAFVGPDKVSTSKYQSFPGTSAATPHAAGAAALVAGGDPSLSPDQVVDRLESSADGRDWSNLPNNRVGSGLVDAAGAIRPPDPVATNVTTSIDAENDDEVPVRVRFPTTPATGEVVVRLEDGEGNAVTGRAPVEDDPTTNVTVDAQSLADGQVTASAKLVDALGNQNPAGFTATSDPVQKATDDTAGIEIADVIGPEKLVAGENLTVTATLRNRADETVEEVVALAVDGRRVTYRSVQLGARTTRIVTFTHDTTGTTPGNHTYTVRSPQDDDRRSVWLRSPEVARAPTVALTPTNGSVGPQGTATYEVVTQPTRGVSNYKVTVSVDDPSVATIQNVELPGSFAYPRTSVSSDGATATAGGIGAGIAPTEDNRTLLSVTVRGEAVGWTDLSVRVESLNDRNNSAYRLSNVGGARLSVVDVATGFDVDGDGRRSTSVDFDQLHEDVDGDGQFGTGDVQTLLDDVFGDGTTRNYPSLYDFDRSGSVGTGDVQALLDELFDR